MKPLQVLNLVLCAVSATLALVLAVVCVLYLANWDQAAKVQRELPGLLSITAGLGALGASSALAWWAQREAKAWALWVQLMLAPLLAGVGFLFLQVSGLR